MLQSLQIPNSVGGFQTGAFFSLDKVVQSGSSSVALSVDSLLRRDFTCGVLPENRFRRLSMTSCLCCGELLPGESASVSFDMAMCLERVTPGTSSPFDLW